MRQLAYNIEIEHLKKIKTSIVPVIFTEHQFQLMEKKMANQTLTNSEKNEFSRTISKKMKAINLITNKETDNIFVYGKEKIIPKRLVLAKKYLKQFSRKFKNRQIIISGSFLYKEKFNDVDVFVISNYEKEDYKFKKFHINFLSGKVQSSLFFASIKKMCISNKKISNPELKEDINIDTFISLYQELFNDLDKKFKGVKSTVRDFLMQSYFLTKESIPDSLELSQQVDSILNIKKSKEIIKKIFVKTIVLGTEQKKAIAVMNEMIDSYTDLMKEYKQHKLYYLDLIQPFKEVISIES